MWVKAITASVLGLLLNSTGFAEIKRTASGKPDLSGFYDSGTLTPLNRPEALGDKQFMTPSEAEQYKKLSGLLASDADEISDPNRSAPPKGGDGQQAYGAGGVGGYNSFWVDPGSDLSELDGKIRTSIIYDPPNGRQPKTLPGFEARMGSRYQSFIHENTGTASWLAHEGEGPFDGPESLAPSERCLISFGATVPNIPSLYNNYKRVVQTDTHVMILQEMVHDARIIRIDSEHTADSNRKWMGDSIAYWDGDMLVVETKNFKSVNGLVGADENLHVTERFSRKENGNLLYDFTVNDPTAWEASWSGKYEWQSKPESKVYEYACHEGNYAMGNILRGARLLESEWQPAVDVSDSAEGAE